MTLPRKPVSSAPHYEPESERVRKMAERWWIQVCPECNGLVGERSQAHNETCPNRALMFVPRPVEVVPAPVHREEGER